MNQEKKNFGSNKICQNYKFPSGDYRRDKLHICLPARHPANLPVCPPRPTTMQLWMPSSKFLSGLHFLPLFCLLAQKHTHKELLLASHKTWGLHKVCNYHLVISTKLLILQEKRTDISCEDASVKYPHPFFTQTTLFLYSYFAHFCSSKLILKMGNSRPVLIHFLLICKQLTTINCSIKVSGDWIRT